ncbi:8-demethylnovobiocic acid synthase [Streptomyces sp. RB5]|uniref:8-demethylnovobiocic acid synthase n=1 Tax=Streptomyces smaragdinus TaxID=2585196 RepID=A0A7K0CG91_9ACTN|nr:fatty acid--CoA ligase family protein [Streptomyces smaragdinus]MQY12487.1 8-demethylnovobiocic acid synthase [Streptomyces smaragdinus]
MRAINGDHGVHTILRALERDPGRPVVHGRGGATTAGELLGSVLATAARLRENRVGPGDTVAVLTEPNRPPMLSARYAVHLLGATCVHIRSGNPRTHADAARLAVQAELLRATRARVLLVDEHSARRAGWLAVRVPDTTVVGIGSGPVTRIPAPVPPAPGAVATVDFTHGSTGRPKLVRQLYTNRAELVGRLAAGLDPAGPATLLSVTPVSHTTAPMADAVLARGGTLVLHDTFDADAVLDATARFRVTDIYLGVPHLYRLLDHPRTAAADFSALRRITYSGTPAAPARVARAVEVFGDVLTQVYGTAEAGGISSLNPLDHREPALLGSAGRPFPWVRVEIRAPATGAPVERGRTGEVWVKSPTVAAGYLGDPASAEAGFRDGWLRTGDLGRWDRYGYLRLTGRTGGVIKRGGLKLDPATIERVLLRHPEVRQAAVYAVRDRDYVEWVHAAVELHGAAGRALCDLREYVAASLTPEYAPDRITVWPQLPLTAAGKIDLSRLRAAG